MPLKGIWYHILLVRLGAGVGYEGAGGGMRRWILRALLGGLVSLGAALSVAWWTATPDIGARASGERLARMAGSPQWDGGGFTNPLVQIDGSMTDVLGKELGENPAVQVPDTALPVLSRTADEFTTLPESGLRVTWLGHSTLLVELDGARILIDPVWGERASPWSSAGPARFFAPPLPLDALPPIDAVIISHDHYDHLDYQTVTAMLPQQARWLVPLGIGAHLEHWGMPAERITELDWWEAVEVAGVVLTATPARHFSGRWLDRFRSTLWAGWAIRGPEHAVFYSGDTALYPELEDIGARLGPFDMTMIDSGAYDSTWTDVHLGPEQAVLAHQLVRGSVLLPVHWGMFDLGNHGWTEPIERTLRAAERQGVRVVTPRPGASVELADAERMERWWPELPYRTLEQDPVWSTSVDALIARWWVPPP